MKTKIVWSSNTSIMDGSLLSTLCVFYDEILLPSINNPGVHLGIYPSDDTELPYSVKHMITFLDREGNPKDPSSIWEEEKKILFRLGDAHIIITFVFKFSVI